MVLLRHLLPVVLAASALAAPALAKGKGGILPGATAKDPLNIDAGKLDFFEKEQKLIYSGSVIVVNGPSTLKASQMTIYLDPQNAAPPQNAAAGGGSKDRVRHIDVAGPVTLVTKDQVGTGDKATYDRAQNKVRLLGNVVWTQGDTVTKGDWLDYDTTTGQAVVGGGEQAKGGRVHSVLTPSEAKSDGKAEAKPEGKAAKQQ